MKNKDNIFVEYDDNNINHVECAPDYGQNWDNRQHSTWNDKFINYSLKCYRPSGSKYRKYNIVNINYY